MSGRLTPASSGYTLALASVIPSDESKSEPEPIDRALLVIAGVVLGMIMSILGWFSSLSHRLFDRSNVRE